jgi:hypothetical protein
MDSNTPTVCPSGKCTAIPTRTPHPTSTKPQHIGTHKFDEFSDVAGVFRISSARVFAEKVPESICTAHAIKNFSDPGG